MTREVGDGAAAGGDGPADGGGPVEGDWTPAERTLLEAALGFYGAAQGVIDYAGRERPRLRQDVAGFEAVRQAMATLEQHVLAAHAAGSTPERIAEVARIDAEMVTLILRRGGTASSPAKD